MSKATQESFATRYRPKTLHSVIGNSEARQSLLGALKKDRIPTAIMISGPSGCGKTTIARAFFNHLRCEHGTACGKCDTCKDDGWDDLVEVNAASDRGIDAMRSLIEVAKFKPQTARRRVIIIDEMHQLSADAQKALLKPLEEPPKDTLFILCTTDPGKVAVAVRNRCQQFSVSIPSQEDLLAYLKKIVVHTKSNLSDDVLIAIGAAAGQSVRESVQLLESTVNYAQSSDKRISDSDLIGYVTSSSSTEGAVSAFEFIKSMYQDDYPSLHTMLLSCDDYNALMNGVLWLNSFMVDVMVLRGAKNKNVWWTPANKELHAWIKSKENRPSLVKAIDVQTALVDLRMSLGFAGLSDRHLIGAKMYSLLERVRDL